MTIGMLIAGIICLLAGILAIGFGIPINEFGLGNTLILAGAVTACTGLIILSLWVVVRELKSIAGRLGADPALDRKGNAPQPVALPRAAIEEPVALEPGGGPPDATPAPWLEEAPGRDRPRQDVPPPGSEPPASKPRRNLMFSSSSRKERERVQARAGDSSATESRPEMTAPPMEISEHPPGMFDDAWPKSERTRPTDAPLPRRAPRTPSTFNETAPGRQAAVAEDQPPVTVLKSGVVDGMAYSLYSDGSIEAQMPEGMMRFASIDELRAHLDQRP